MWRITATIFIALLAYAASNPAGRPGPLEVGQRINGRGKGDGPQDSHDHHHDFPGSHNHHFHGDDHHHSHEFHGHGYPHDSHEDPGHPHYDHHHSRGDHGHYDHHHSHGDHGHYDHHHSRGDHDHDDHHHSPGDHGHDHAHPHGSHEDHDHDHDHQFRRLCQRPSNPFHGNIIPCAKDIPKNYTHAVCHITPSGRDGTINIRGVIHMEQDWMGIGDVTMNFSLSGFDHSAHNHDDTNAAGFKFTINRNGDITDGCSKVGAVFTPPHPGTGERGKGGHSGHGPAEHSAESTEEAGGPGAEAEHSAESTEEAGDPYVEAELSAESTEEAGEPGVNSVVLERSNDGSNVSPSSRDHDHQHGGPHGHYRRRGDRDGAPRGDRPPEGELHGDFMCEPDGTFVGGYQFNSVSLLGFHSIIGRSFVIKNSDNETLACGAIGHSDGSFYGHADRHPWLLTERAQTAEPLT